MRRIVTIIIVTVIGSIIALPQQKATVKEYKKAFKTYPFSDQDPIPQVEPMAKFGKIYPYSRFNGYTTQSVEKEWKVVELENDYIRVMIMPEIGGKVWAAIEKVTGLSFIYNNTVIKFRDIGIRGPWTKGGIEFNYGIVGHAPGCGTPVDYTILNKPDGSVSCVIGLLDLLTRTSWRVDINLPKDKAYFTLSSFWYNSSPVEQPYYSWLNVGIKADGNLQFIFPGTKWIEHNGGYSSWPINKENGKDVSFYKNNDFGGYKSYHVFGEHSEFFGGYWHDDDFGMGRYSTRDDKAGQKLWISGLSDQGMIFERILTDKGGQSLELQSGRLFNQTWTESTFTPFKHKGFLPHTTDLWTEYLFPVVKTKGYVTANNYGVLNLENKNGWLKIYFSPLQNIQDKLTITDGGKIVYTKMLSLKPLELFSDSIQIKTDKEQLCAVLGDKKLEYTPPSQNTLSRPVSSPGDFDWNSVYGLYLLGKEKIRERQYVPAEEKIRACLKKDPNYLPALTDLSMLLYQRMQYADALVQAKRALSVDTYDPAANYYYGLINSNLGNMADAKDGFEISSMGMDYRSASWSMLSGLYLKEMNLSRSVDYARRSIDFNHYAVDAYQLLAVDYRLMKNRNEADKILDTLLRHDPLSHFACFERYLWDGSEEDRNSLTGLIRSDMPQEIYLELAIWYNSIGRKEEAVKALRLAPQNAEVSYWLTFLTGQPPDNTKLDPAYVFPFRQETGEILTQLIQENDNWMLKYHLALIHWNLNNIAEAGNLFSLCGDLPGHSPFYATRAIFYMKNDSTRLKALNDLQHAARLDGNQWRHGKNLISYYLSEKKYKEALGISEEYYARFPENYYIGLLYIKALINNGLYSKASKLLNIIQVLPNEGASEAKRLFKETYLMLALEEMKNNRFRKALSCIDISRQWPDNLGVGKPYDSDIDERLEDWFAMECYSKLGDKVKAQQMLNRILSFKPQKTAYINTFSSANNLVTAWAVRRSGKTTEAEAYLDKWINREPSNPLARWVNNIYKGFDYIQADETQFDENYRLLKKFTQIYNSIQ